MKLSKEDVLREARSVIRDLIYGFAEDELCEDPRVVCQNLSEILGEDYDFETGETKS
jgi:hypothetical protein